MRASPPSPARFAGAMRYEHSDIPPGMTLVDWRRRRRRAPKRRAVFARFVRRVGPRR